MFNKAIIFVILVIFWAGLSTKTEAFFAYAGLMSCLGAWWLAIRLNLHKKIGVKPSFFKYLLWLAKEIILSSVFVLRKIWAKKIDVNGSFVELENLPKNELFYAIYGNSITLTPGTVTVQVDEKNGKILTHALMPELGHNLTEDIMANKIKEALK